MNDEVLIPLGRGHSAKIDRSDYGLVSRFKWHCEFSRNTIYASATPKYRVSYKMHRLIMQAPDGLLVDHINGDGLDNRRVNLRLCTARQNTQHSTRLRSDNTSGYPGVHRVSRSHRWFARIKLNGKVVHLGCFETVDEAILARKAAESEHYKEFAPSITTGLDGDPVDGLTYYRAVEAAGQRY